MMYVEVQRLSDSVDTIPVMVSERMLDVNKNFTGQYVSVNGQFRSHNQGDRGDGKRKLMLYVFVLLISYATRCSVSVSEIFLM